MKKLTCVALAALGVAIAAGSASAEELWDPHLRGVDEGLAAGALPPPGVYGVLDNYWAGYSGYNSSGHKTDLHLDALIEIPIILWNPGIKVLGADYAMAIAQAGDYTNARVGSTALGAGHWGTFNTILVPGILSWSLEHDLHVKTGLTIYANDASSSAANPPSGGGLGAGNGFWSVQPDFGISWLHDGWNLSADMHYTYNFADSGWKQAAGGPSYTYTSGQEITGDYTVTKTIGKWTAGVGAFSLNQITDDSGYGAVLNGCGKSNGCKAVSYGAGPILGYQFGGVSIMGQYSHNIYTENDVAGEMFNVRLVAPF
ncbi:hypothetical protein GALL_208190 [mine drainage metagenome]|uniref:Protein involved in meta-pathway of phenol degradation n=1 Tax=mine drainage metagenome TaxID=410659 RepID=A0A1J5RLN7_9ZZZZ